MQCTLQYEDSVKFHLPYGSDFPVGSHALIEFSDKQFLTYSNQPLEDGTSTF